MQDEILFQVRNRIGHVTLNRPAALNALSYAMIEALADRLQCWAADPQVNAVVVRGTGDKAFCAAGDVGALYESYRSGGAGHGQFFVAEYALDHAIHRYAIGTCSQFPWPHCTISCNLP
jgi:enoyl-CoA hydratase/carnithine racemase